MHTLPRLHPRPLSDHTRAISGLSLVPMRLSAKLYTCVGDLSYCFTLGVGKFGWVKGGVHWLHEYLMGWMAAFHR